MSECVSCGSVTGPPPRAGGEGRKMKSDKNFFFHTLSANFFILDFLLVAKVIVMCWKYETSQQEENE